MAEIGGEVNAKKIYMALGVVCLLAAMVDSSWYRYAWVLFGLAFIIATDLIKDVEKTKRKERALTEIRMKQEWLDAAHESEDARDERFVNAITRTSEPLLKQLATYVRVGTPDCNVPHHDQKFWDEASLRDRPIKEAE